MDNQAKSNYLLYTDLNNFKPINDAYGHDIGDRVIEHYIEVLIEKCHEEIPIIKLMMTFLRVSEMTNRVFRYGGDEILVVINNYDNEIDRIIQCVHKKLIMEFPIESNIFCGLSASAGIIDLDEMRPISLGSGLERNPIGIAESVMYFAKGLAKQHYLQKEGEPVKNGFYVVRQWDDFASIEKYTETRTGPKPDAEAKK